MVMTTADYDALASGTTRPAKLLSQVTCPHCWESFSPEDVLWISEHVDLLGDPLLGPEQQQRFLPSRFTMQGDAIDSKGMTCRSPGLPRCHLPMPAGHARDGAAVHLDPGSTCQRQVVLPHRDDLADCASSCRSISRSPSPTPTRHRIGS